MKHKLAAITASTATLVTVLFLSPAGQVVQQAWFVKRGGFH
jgi:hypothetical protein